MRICFVLVFMLLISISSAQNNSTMYKDNGISFEIPQNWNVVKDIQEGNVTQIVLSDGINAIRMDLIKNSDINTIIGEYLDYHVSKSDLSSLCQDAKNMTDTEWHSAYKKFPWYSNDAISEYYQKNIVRPNTQLGGTGSGISVKPDGVAYAGIATNNGHHDDKEIDEWFISWTKPEYDNEIIGVHSLFKGDYPSVEIEWRGSSTNYAMPEPLWIVLTTFNRGNEPLPKPATGSSLVDLV